MLIDYINIEVDLAAYYLIDFIIAIALLSAIRYLAGWVSNVSSTDELAQKDNKAFGVSIAGAMIAVSIMLVGVVSGESGYSLANEALNMVVFGFSGIVLMWLTRILFDRISFPNVSIQSLIMQGNLSASLIDASNMIATAIIIQGAMTWVNGDLSFSLFAVILSFLAAQIILALATYYRVRVYQHRHVNKSLHDAIASNNLALAIRFSAYRIGVAIAVSAAFTLVEYEQFAFMSVFLIWFVAALGIFVLLNLSAIVIRLAVLKNIDVAQEVGEQENIAVGAIEGSIYIVVGLLIAGLIAA